MKQSKTKQLRMARNLLIAAGALCAGAAQAGTATFDFNSDPAGILNLFGSGYWQPGGGATGGDTDGYLVVTDAVDSQNSRIVFDDFDNGKVVKSFTFEADLRVGNGDADPADGFSVNFARAGDPVIEAGTWDQNQNCEANLPEEGTQTGIAIGFDAWNSGTGSSCDVVDSSIGPDVMAVSVRVDGIIVGQFPMPTRNGSCTDATSLQTGPHDPANFGAVDGLCWAKLKVELTPDAKLNVWWKGTQLLNGYQTAYFPSPGRLVFGGRTGGNNQNQHVDNIVITTQVEEADTEAPTAPTALAATTPVGAGRVELTWSPSTDNSGRVAYEVSRDDTVIASTLLTNRFVDVGVAPGKTYTYKVRANDITPNYSTPATAQATTAADVPVTGTVKAEIFTGINGTGILDLTAAQKFLDNAFDKVAYANRLQFGNQNGTAGWNESFGDNFGMRVTGVLTPVESGQYHFFIRSDDASALYLNQSGATLPDISTATPLIEETGCCAAFLEPDSADPATTAEPITLTAGQRYGFVVLMKEGGGGDGFAVGMRKVGDTTAAANVPAIPAQLLSGSGDPVGAALNFTRNLGNVTIIANERLSLTGVATNASPYGSGIWYQWLRNGTPIAGATSTNYVIPAIATTETAAKYSLIAGSQGIVKTSAVATITVNADTRRPLLSRATPSEALNAVDIRFSEPVTSPTATTAGNYTFSGGLTASSATLVDPFTVRVATSAQTEGSIYTATVQNVQDNAGNIVSTNNTITFKSQSLVPNRAKMEVWTGISGTAVSELLNSADYTEAPDRIEYVPGLNTPDLGIDNYGARVSGYLIPKESGQYHMFIRSDDASQLYLSMNNTWPVPGTDTPLIEETGCCSAFLEPGNTDKPTVTTATPVTLTAGQRYPVVVILKEGGGGDWMQVAMRKVGVTNAASSLQPLSDQIFWFGSDTDVLRATDTIVATSTNSPAAERAPNAIDRNPATKYLNFDKLNAGFTVTTTRATTIRGIALTSANDAPERDPASVRIEGSVNGTTWETVATLDLPLFPDRFVRREFFFNNDIAYTSYRVTFPTVVNATAANSMQIADVELLGYSGGLLAVAPQNPTVSVTRAANGDLTISYQGTLESADTLVSPTWTAVPGTSPLTVTPNDDMKFYRARQ